MFIWWQYKTKLNIAIGLSVRGSGKQLNYGTFDSFPAAGQKT